MSESNKFVQLSRFLVLMQNYETALKSTDTALNSTGSGVRENEQYLNSLEARLNRVKNAWTELAINTGDAVLSDGIVAFSEVMVDITKSASGLVKEIGFLPPILGITSGAIMLLNSNLRATLLTKHKNIASATTLGNVWTAMATKAKVAGTMVATSFRFIAASIPPVAIFMGVGFAIEKMISSFAKARQEVQELQREVDNLVNSYDSNITELDKLVKKYEELNKKVANNEISSDNADYLETQQKIYEILPHLAERVEETEDGKTQAYLKTAEAIRKEVSALEELRGLESKKFVEEFGSSLNKINNDIEETENRIAKIGKPNSRANSITGGGVSVISGELSTEQQAQKIIDERELNNLLDDRVSHYKKLATEYANEIGIKQSLTEADQSYINTTIEKNKKLLETEEGQTKLRNNIELLVGDLGELRDVLGSSFDLSFLENIDIQPNEILNSDEMLNALQQINNEIKSSNPNWENLKQSLVNAGLSFEDAESIINGFNSEYQKTQELLDMGLFRDAEGQFPIKSHEEYNKVVEDGGEIYHEVDGKIVKLNDSIIDLTQSKQQLADISQVLYGVNKDEVELLEYHARIYEVLSQQQNLNAEQTKALAQAKDYLSKKYPHLIQNEQLLIKEIYNEIGADKALLEATAGLASGMLTNQQAMTATALIESKNRIKILKKEIQIMQEMMEKVNLTIFGEEGGIHGATTGTANALRLRIDELSDLNVELEKSHQKLATDFNSQVSADKSSGSSSSTNNPSQKDETDALIRQFNLEQELLSLDSEKIRKQIELAKSQGDINKQLELTKQLTENENKRISEIKQVKDLLHEQANAIRNANKQYNTSKWFDPVTNEETINFIEEYEKASKEQQEEMSEVFSALQKLKNAYGDTNSEIVKLKDSTRELTLENEQLTEQIKEDLANDVIDAYKDAYQMQNQIVQDGIDNQMKSLEDAHNRKMQMYDDELSKFENTINGQLRALNDAENEDDFNKQIQGLQEDELKLRQQINKKSLDGSQEVQSEVMKLEEDLQKKLEEIEDLRSKRTKDLRKQNLQDLLDEKRAEIQNEKDTAEELYDINRDRLDKEKEYWNRHYENLINDERRWVEVREQIMNENVNTIISEFANLENSIKPHMELIGESITENLIDKLAEVKQQLLGLTTGNYSAASSKSSDADTIAKMKTNSQKWHDSSVSERSKLEAKNQELGASIGATHKYGYWYKDGKRLYHDGGLVGNKSSRLGELVDNLFNAKSGEMVVKSLVGEAQIPPQNFGVGIGRIQDALQRARQSTPNTITIGSLMQVDKIDKNVDVHSLTKQVADNLIQFMKPYGFTNR